MLPREYRIFKEYGNIRHANLLSLMACATTPSRIPSVQRSPHLSSRVAGSTIKEGDIPLSKVLKTSGFAQSLQKVSKECGDRGIVGFHFVR